MKIKWIGEVRQIPGIGILKEDDVVMIPDDMALSLIMQRLAMKYIDKAVEPAKTKADKSKTESKIESKEKGGKE